MNKFLTVFVSLFLVLVMVLVGCAAPPAPTTELKACDVKLSAVTPIFNGTESVSYSTTFVISNPNSFEVAVNSFECTLTAEDKILLAKQYSGGIYIPGGKQAEISFPFVYDFGSLVAVNMMAKGFPPAEATGASLPFWKSIGGKLPVPAMKDAFDKLTDNKLVFKARGSTTVSGAGLKTSQPFNLQLTEE